MTTLYDKLIEVGHQIPISTYSNKYIQDSEVVALIKKKIIQSYESHPVISRVINRETTIEETISPIAYKAREVLKKYGNVRFARKFNPEKHVFGGLENSIAEELKDILDVKKHYTKGFIFSDKIDRIARWVIGYNTPNSTNKQFTALLRNSLPFVPLAYYVLGKTIIFNPPGNSPLAVRVIVNSMLAMLGGGVCGCVISLPFGYLSDSTPFNKIERPTKELIDNAQFLDRTIAETYK